MRCRSAASRRASVVRGSTTNPLRTTLNLSRRRSPRSRGCASCCLSRTRGRACVPGARTTPPTRWLSTATAASVKWLWAASIPTPATSSRPAELARVPPVPSTPPAHNTPTWAMGLYWRASTATLLVSPSAGTLPGRSASRAADNARHAYARDRRRWPHGRSWT